MSPRLVKGAVAYGNYFFPKKFEFVSLCSFICLLCINFQDLCARLLGMAALRILLLTFISRFVIDFLSIRKVIIFSAIATDNRHPLRSRSIHQNVFGKSIPPSGKQLLRTKQLDLTKQQDKHLLTFVLTQIFSVLMVVGPSSGVNEQWEIVPTHAFTGVH